MNFFTWNGKCYVKYVAVLRGLNLICLTFCTLKSKYLVLQSGKVDSGKRVFDIPGSSEGRLVAGRVNVTLKFASENLAVLADGTGRLFFLSTGDRQTNEGQWKVKATKLSPIEKEFAMA